MGFFRKVKNFSKKLLDTASRVAKRVAPVVQKIAPVIQSIAPMLGPKGAIIGKAAGIAGRVADRFQQNDGDIISTGRSFLSQQLKGRFPNASPQIDSPRIGLLSRLQQRGS